MEWLHSLLDSSTTPILTALLLGLITALSPCPLATNIAAIGYIARQISSKKQIFRNGLLFTLGKVIAYTLLGAALIVLIQGGSSMFGLQKFISKYGEILIGPTLVVIGGFMLFGHKLRLPGFRFNTDKGEQLAHRGGWGAFILGIIFALAFCPSSGIFYFGMLIPMSATFPWGYILPVFFAITSALPVIIFAWIIAFSAKHIGKIYSKMQTIQKWLNITVGILFTTIGIYYCIIIYL